MPNYTANTLWNGVCRAHIRRTGNLSIMIYFPRFHGTCLLIINDKRKRDRFSVFPPRNFLSTSCAPRTCSGRPRRARNPLKPFPRPPGRLGPRVASRPSPAAARTPSAPASPRASPSQHSPVTRMDSSIVPPRPRGAGRLQGRRGRGPARTGRTASRLEPQRPGRGGGLLSATWGKVKRTRTDEDVRTGLGDALPPHRRCWKVHTHSGSTGGSCARNPPPWRCRSPVARKRSAPRRTLRSAELAHRLGRWRDGGQAHREREEGGKLQLPASPAQARGPGGLWAKPRDRLGSLGYWCTRVLSDHSHRLDVCALFKRA